jgi:hypothetical protein
MVLEKYPEKPWDGDHEVIRQAVPKLALPKTNSSPVVVLLHPTITISANSHEISSIRFLGLVHKQMR